jgi:hypothetical protein
MCEMAVAA